MKKIVMFVYGGIFPVSQGNERVFYEMAKYLHEKGHELTLLLVGAVPNEFQREYETICSRVIHIPSPSQWGIWGIANKIVARCGLDALRCLFLSLALRRHIKPILQDADVVIAHYLAWLFAFPLKVIKKKLILVTHDLLFYRRASFMGLNTLVKKSLHRINRALELKLLMLCNKVCVFADYEKSLLLEGGVPENRILKLGMPMQAPKHENVVKRKRSKYDFIFVGGNSYQNEQGIKFFLEKILPLLNGRGVSFAVAGSVCNSSMWDAQSVPSNVSLCRLGFVDDLSRVFADSCIGVGTLPYGSGVKVKVVECIFNGLPIVATNTGLEGIPLPDESCVNVDALSVNEISHKLNAWLDNPEMAYELGQLGRRAVERAFSSETALRVLNDAVTAV